MPTRRLTTSYRDDLRLIQSTWHVAALLVGVAVVLCYPFAASARWLTVGNLALVATVGSTALMVLTGFAGQISLGHAAFLALGAYTTAALGRHAGLPFWLCLPAAGLVAAAVGTFVGFFTVRLRGLYLAIVTLGLVFIVNHVLLTASGLTGGLSGTVVPAYAWFAGADAGHGLSAFTATTAVGPLAFTLERKLYFIFLAIAAATLLAAHRLARSPSGRAMMAVRDRDLAAASVGVDLARTKLLAFGVSSFFAGVAGGMFALQQQYITVEPPFDLSMSVAYIAMIVLGGIGTVFGAAAGAIAFTALTPLAEALARHLPLLSRLPSGQQSTVVFAVAVCAVLVFEPLGLYGVWLRVQRYFAAWPFKY
jgi:branched-chain amino acid transport system permease protein